MCGLLIKDTYSMIKETKIFLIFVIIMALVQNDFLFTYAIFYSAMLPISSLAYDERSKWNVYADMLPYTTGQIVGSKYMIGYLSVGFSILLVLCGKLLGAGFGNGMPEPSEWASLITIGCAANLVQAVNLPLIFWIGVEKGRYLFILIVVGATLAAVTFMEHIDYSMTEIPLAALMLCILALTVAGNILSFFISKKIYCRRQ